MSRSGIPELIVGTILLYGFWKLGVPALSVYTSLGNTIVDPSDRFMLAGYVFIIGTWLLIGAYFYSLIFERVCYWGFEQYKSYKIKMHRDEL